jgi:uridine phosphorylase
MATTGVFKIDNPHVSKLDVDNFYHLGFNTGMPLKEMFGDVKYVFYGGANDRMKKIAQSFADAFWPLPLGQELTPIGATNRYHMFKIGQVITCSHQMGMPSFSILLHEMTKMLAAAGATNVTFIRIGTSGGVGVPGGTLVITNRPVNGYLEPEYEIISLGKLHKRPARLDEGLRAALLECAKEGGHTAISGDTMSVDCFYEGQGRLDGAICHYEDADKLAFLKKACDAGVRNIEMESAMFGAFCHQLNIRAGVICCTLLNRMDGDQVTMTPENYKNWVGSVIDVCIRLVAKELSITRKN